MGLPGTTLRQATRAKGQGLLGQGLGSSGEQREGEGGWILASGAWCELSREGQNTGVRGVPRPKPACSAPGVPLPSPGGWKRAEERWEPQGQLALSTHPRENQSWASKKEVRTGKGTRLAPKGLVKRPGRDGHPGGRWGRRGATPTCTPSQD